jgi:hypothetical protein
MATRTFTGDASPQNLPHSLAKEPSYVHYKQLKNFKPRVEVKTGAWVVDTRNGEQGKLKKVGRKRGSRGLFGWMDHPCSHRAIEAPGCDAREILVSAGE